jgi:hypothetical protein
VNWSKGLDRLYIVAWILWAFVFPAYIVLSNADDPVFQNVLEQTPTSTTTALSFKKIAVGYFSVLLFAGLFVPWFLRLLLGRVLFPAGVWVARGFKDRESGPR